VADGTRSGGDPMAGGSVLVGAMDLFHRFLGAEHGGFVSAAGFGAFGSSLDERQGRGCMFDAAGGGAERTRASRWRAK